MKKKYVSMELEILSLSQLDVICTSGSTPDVKDVYDGNFKLDEWFGFGE